MPDRLISYSAHIDLLPFGSRKDSRLSCSPMASERCRLCGRSKSLRLAACLLPLATLKQYSLLVTDVDISAVSFGTCLFLSLLFPAHRNLHGVFVSRPNSITPQCLPPCPSLKVLILPQFTSSCFAHFTSSLAPTSRCCFTSRWTAASLAASPSSPPVCSTCQAAELAIARVPVQEEEGEDDEAAPQP